MVEAAYSLFVEEGYASVTVDDIIRIAGGSKSSLYKFFGNKEGILKAVVESLANRMLDEIEISFSPKRTPRDTLTRIGLTVGELALSDNAINQYRLAVFNAKVLPKAAKLWYEAGPNTSLEGIAEHLRKEAAGGRLHVENPRRAAEFFLGMIIFKHNMTRSIGAPPPPREELEEIVAEAVDVFLAAYGNAPS